MNPRSQTWRGRRLAIARTLRTWGKVAKGTLSTDHVILAHIIPIRRCNLACTYCNEFDKHSAPVPLGDLQSRLDFLASFGTSIVTISGGEPLLHPELDEVIRHIRRRGMIAGMITNGYLLTGERIERLNQAGLEYLQISIDNVQPDEVSKKSLKVLDQKLQSLAERAEFHVNINSVLGSGVKKPEDALTVARRAVQLGFTSTVGILHDGSGQLKPLGEREREIFVEIMRLGKRSFARINGFQSDIAAGREHQWRCRAGSRYLYVCEDGLVHYCSQQRGYPGIPIEQYTAEMRRREFFTRKGCAPRCTISCVQQVAAIDNWRAPQNLDSFAGPAPTELVQLGGANRSR
ncbi:MAG TPA: radical SAM protein [Candidatus Dormibacteraeota bacterium]|nr:radical SAM protein [Candidatus Dormibacteraeota bacterium]